jgi:hypothetical protein
LEKLKIPYMLVGGVAANYYGFPRATIDIDFVIRLESDKVGEFVQIMERAGFNVSGPEVKMMVEVGNRFVMTFPKTGHRIDFWLAKSDYDRETLQHRRRAQIFNTRTWICSPEDLILSKLHAGRPKDIEDAIGILHRQRGKLQMRYLSRCAAMLGVSKELKKLLKEVEK